MSRTRTVAIASPSVTDPMELRHRVRQRSRCQWVRAEADKGQPPTAGRQSRWNRVTSPIPAKPECSGPARQALIRIQGRALPNGNHATPYLASARGPNPRLPTFALSKPRHPFQAKQPAPTGTQAEIPFAVRMKIAFPYPGYWPYVRRGIERCIHDVAGHLAERGHEVHVITSTPGRPRVAFDGAVKVTYVRQFSHPLVYGYMPRLRRLAFAAEASRILAADRADVAHLWNYSLPWAPITRRWLDLPYVFQVGLRGSRLPSGQTRRPLRRLGTIDIRRADRVVALTPGGAAEVRSKFGVECGVLAPPVDMRLFRPVAARRDRPEVLFTSDLADPLKGGRLLLRAWNAIHQQCPEAVLVVAGPYGLAGYSQLPIAMAESAVRELVSPSARDSVELRGPGSIEGLPAWYSQASVTVLPSIGEAFGMVLTESLACGTPVVSSSGEGPGEIVTNPDVGRTVELLTRSDLESDRRAQQLADAVLSTIELSRTPGVVAHCREWASRWSLDKIGFDEERMLQEVIDGHRVGRRAVA